MSRTLSSTAKRFASRLLIAVVILQNFAFSIPAANAALVNGMDSSDAFGPQLGSMQYGMYNPSGVVRDAVHNRLFVADTSNNRILVFNTASVTNGMNAVKVLGQSSFYTAANSTSQSGLRGPYGLAYDSVNDRLFVADRDNSRVIVYDTDTITDGEPAVHVLGQAGYGTDGCGTGAAEMCAPSDVAYDAAIDRLFVVDTLNNRVVIFDDVSPGNITNGQAADKVIGQTTFGTASAGNTGNEMSWPTGVSYGANALFVSEQNNHRVTMFDATFASLSSGDPASVVLGQTGFGLSTSGNSATKMAYPQNVEYDATGNRLYVSDSGNGRVTIFNTSAISSGDAAINVLGQAAFGAPSFGSAAANLISPNAATYSAGKLYVADSGNNRVTIFDATAPSNGDAADNVLGQTGFGASSSAQPTSDFEDVRGVALDPDHHRLFVADTGHNRVVVYNLGTDDTLTDHTPDNVLGQPNLSSFDCVDEALLSGKDLCQPTAVKYSENKLYVVDAGRNRVLIFDVTAVSNYETAVDVIGQTDANVGPGDAGYPEAPTFTRGCRGYRCPTRTGMGDPVHSTVDSVNHRLFVADGYGGGYGGTRILIYDLDDDNEPLDYVPDHVLNEPDFNSRGEGDLYGPSGLAYDPDNDYLFVTYYDSSTIAVYDVDPGTLVDGQTYFAQLGDSGGGHLGYVFQLRGAPAIDVANRRLFVSDTFNHRVLVYDITTVSDGQAPERVLGQPNFETNNVRYPNGFFGSPTATGMFFPSHIAYDAVNNRIFVNDGGESRVLVFDVGTSIGSITNGQAAAYVLGAASFSQAAIDQSCDLNANDLCYGFGGLAYDNEHDRLYASGSGQGGVLVYTGASTLSNNRAANFVIGAADFSSYGPGITRDGLNSPYGLWYDPVTDRLYVSDNFANRVMAFNVTTAANGPLAEFVLGQMDAKTGDTQIFTKGGRQSMPNRETLDLPTDVTIDTVNHRLYVSETFCDDCDGGNERVAVYDLDDNNDLVDHFPDYAIGQPDLNTAILYTASQTNLYAPSSVAVDADNAVLYVADSFSYGQGNRIMVFDVSDGNIADGIAAEKVLGQTDYDSTSSGTSQTLFSGPSGLSYDAGGQRLFVSDSGNNRVLVFDTTSIGEFAEPADYVLGQPNFTSGDPSSGIAGLSSPRGLSYGGANDILFVAENGNARVSVFDFDGPVAVPPPTSNTTSNRVLMSRLQVGTVADIMVSFDLTDTLSSDLIITFAPEFTGLSVAGAVATTPDAPDCITSITLTGPNEITATKDSCTGAIVISGITAINPGTPGSYIVSWVNDSPGYSLVAIVDSDQVTVNASVDPTITFDLDTGIAAGEIAAPYSVALGALTVGAVNHSDNSTVNSIFAQLDTNATGGAQVTVLSANAALKSTSAPADTIPNAATSMAAGIANYGICVNSVTPPSEADGTFQASAPYNAGACDPAGDTNAVKALSTVTPTNILDSASAPVTGGEAEIIVNAAISTATAAHSDYTDTLTFVATGTF